MNDLVDAVIYINLDRRTDRRIDIEKELQKVFPPEKIHRLTATPTSPGWFGCSHSHIRALETARVNGWNTTLIVEDDMMWTEHYEDGVRKIQALSDSDVIVLCGQLPEYNTETFRLQACSSTVSYIVKRDYIDTLYTNFTTGLRLLMENPRQTGEYCIDQQWKHLMPNDRWQIIVPGMATQRPSQSDLAGSFVDLRNRLS